MACDIPRLPATAQHSVQAAPRRDPGLAVLQEYEAAKKKNTLAAWDLFLARHPNSPYAALARAARDRIAAQNSR